MALYGAPIWVDALNVRNLRLLRRPQRVMAIRAIRGYRTISFEAACALAGTPPWDLDAKTLAYVYRKLSESRTRKEYPLPDVLRRWRKTGRQAAMLEWERRMEEPSAGHRTMEAIRPILTQWVERKHGALSFRLVQVLTGHGCFGHYLFKVPHREPTPACHECGCDDDTAQHTLEECSAWTRERRVLVDMVGSDLSLPALMNSMLGSERSWEAVVTFCENVVLQKETAEREREVTTDLSMRRRRIGRRRRIYALLQPP